MVTPTSARSRRTEARWVDLVGESWRHLCPSKKTPWETLRTTFW
jgi:hypothetical protein